MESGSPYRPGTARRGPRPAAVITIALLLVAFVVAAVFFLIHKPGLPTTATAAPAPAPAAATPAPPVAKPTPAPVAVNPSDPASYLELMNADPASLSPDQAKIADALTHNALVASKAPEGYLPLMAQLSQNVFGPLNAGKTKADFDPVRAAGQALRDEVQKSRDYFVSLQSSLSADLVKSGLAPDLAGGVAGKFIERAQSKRTALYDAVDKVGADAIACVDTLEKNANAWHRDPEGKLSFRSKAVMDEFDGASSRLRADVDLYNGSAAQYR